METFFALLHGNCEILGEERTSHSSNFALSAWRAVEKFFFHPLFTSRHVFSCIKQLLYALLWCEKGRDLIKNSRGTGKKFSFAFFLLIEIRTFSVEITLEKAQRRRGAERYSKLSMHENGKTIRGFSRAQRN